MTRLLTLLAVLWPVAAPAQTPAETTQTASASESRPDDPEEGSWLDDWLPLPVVFYVPETNLGLGAMLVHNFDGPDNEGGRRSSAQVRSFYTLNSQYSAYTDANLWMGGDRYNLSGFVEYRIYPFQFFGVGNDPDIDNFESYTEEAIETKPRFAMRVYESLRLGVNTHVLHGTVRDFPEDGMLASAGVTGLGTNTFVGLGPSVDWDTRDSVFWPSSGNYIISDLTFYTPDFGSDADFVRFLFDARHYQPLWLGHVFAAQAYVEMTVGQVPFQLLPSLGGTNVHRGWFAGALRDQHAYAVQIEYRAPIWWRLGLVAFASAGQVVPTVSAVDPSELRYAAGGGVRFRANADGMNIRFDVAYGARAEFYFQILEAF